MSRGRVAVFLDRDGTIIHDTGYVAKPNRVSLIAGAAAAIRRLNQANVPVIVVSNQSGIGRGYHTEADFHNVQARIAELLAAEHAHVDAVYFCPHAPDQEPPCECRKPGAKLFRDAAAKHGLDLARSWYVGDRWRDVAVVNELGGHGILVPTDTTDAADIVRAEKKVRVSTTLGAAVDRILSHSD
ncbi:MAG TPA: HAD family hydrolase [Gemmatimonadaceae bacterium]|nr:HAD family hydrolase [Gemmatimonadaceae bacterium]